MVGLRIRCALRPAQHAYGGGALPGALVDAEQRDHDPRRGCQANYRAVQAMAQVGIAEFGVYGTGVDADVQVDVAFANLEQVGPRFKLARDRLRPRAANHHLGQYSTNRSASRPPLQAQGTTRRRCTVSGTGRAGVVGMCLWRQRIRA
jgi:hypothetical protein